MKFLIYNELNQCFETINILISIQWSFTILIVSRHGSSSTFKFCLHSVIRSTTDLATLCCNFLTCNGLSYYFNENRFFVIIETIFIYIFLVNKFCDILSRRSSVVRWSFKRLQCIRTPCIRCSRKCDSFSRISSSANCGCGNF